MDVIWFGLYQLGVAVWLGGLATIVVVVVAAGRSLDESARVAFFRQLGRGYLPVGVVAMLAWYAGGLALLLGQPWSALSSVAVGLAVLLALALLLGVRQARRITVLRRQALAEPVSGALATRTRAGAQRATALRTVIAVLSLALVLVGILIGG
ncbi:MAG TPA: hypothetical protein VFN19_04045 [Candidatus Nanopelagicales bacterium]|nr:hypothetical protein [Candidatus Nanopelagicales bacterium]